jgi:hypothetical protein
MQAMALSVVHLGVVELGDALVSLPVESAPGDVYLPPTAEIKLFLNSLPSFIPNLQAGLVKTGATLVNGRVVETAADTIMWALEQLQAAAA